MSNHFKDKGMINPTMVYKRGTKIKVDGAFFDYKIVDSVVPDGAINGAVSELEAALKDDGWFRTPLEALDGMPADNEMPTRKELKAMADQLDLKYPQRISTADLAELVDKATKGDHELD